MGQPVPEPPLVLIADDDSLVRVALRLAVSSRGWQVVEAADFEQLARCAAERPPDICLLDANMPGSDLGSRIDSLAAAGVSVVVMSGQHSSPPAADGLPFVRKPVELATLMRVLDDTMSTQATRSESHR